MSYIRRYAKLPDALPAAETLAVWSKIAGEERLYELPSLVSWVDAAAADGSGNYFDKGPLACDWLQATVGNQPPLLTDWHGLTGVSAWDFDGTGGDYIDSNFTMPAGEFSVAIVADIHTSIASDGQTHIPVGDGNSANANGWYLGVLNRLFKLASPGRSLSAINGSVAVVNTPHLILASISMADAIIKIEVDGGTVASTAIASTQFNIPAEPAVRLGRIGPIGLYYKGAIARAQIFSGSLHAETRSVEHDAVVAVNKAAFGIA